MEHIVYIGLTKLGARALTLWQQSHETLRSMWNKKSGKAAIISMLGSCSVALILYHKLKKRKL
jgi:hypothetical protein